MNLVTCVSSKDLITYINQSKIFYNSEINIYIISKPFVRLVMKFSLLFKKTKCNFIFINEKKLLKSIGIIDFYKIVQILNYSLIPKVNWYKQQILKYAIGLRISENYIIIDADTFPTIVDNILNLDFDLRFYNHLSNKIYTPYELTYNRIFQKSTISNYDFVCEVFPIDINVLNKMISDIESLHNDVWYNVIIKSTSDLIGFSEYQTYGRFHIENYLNARLVKFPSNRHFGKKQLSIYKTVNLENSFVSYESYDYPDNYQKILYFIFYKPYFLIVKFFNL